MEYILNEDFFKIIFDHIFKLFIYSYRKLEIIIFCKFWELSNGECHFYAMVFVKLLKKISFIFYVLLEWGQKLFRNSFTQVNLTFGKKYSCSKHHFEYKTNHFNCKVWTTTSNIKSKSNRFLVLEMLT